MTFSLTAAPSGMTIDPQGLIIWLPGPGQVGAHRVALMVADGRGGTTAQSYDLTVTTSPSNGPPAITSTPRLDAVVGRPYRLDLEAVDPDGDPVVWTLVEGPRGMALGLASGVLTWLPAADQIGGHTVTVRAEDPFSAAATQTFTLAVSAVNRPPVIASVPPTGAAVDRPFAYSVRAVDPDGDRLTFSLQSSPAGMTVDGDGTGPLDADGGPGRPSPGGRRGGRRPWQHRHPGIRP